ncbi:MAG: ABC transporter substrate-binding protein, partial [Burkholderiaceae bacterium]|nr:ABC transporter substrate-binding protein [Burkholderiaceae bacterium]
MMNRRFLGRLVASLAAVWALAGAGAVHAADEAPDAMVQRLSTEVLDALRADKSIKAGDLDKVIALVDKTIMPNVNFRRMTAAAVGPGWRKASPEQQKRLQ